MYSKFNCDISNYFYNEYINQYHETGRNPFKNSSLSKVLFSNIFLIEPCPLNLEIFDSGMEELILNLLFFKYSS